MDPTATATATRRGTCGSSTARSTIVAGRADGPDVVFYTRVSRLRPGVGRGELSPAEAFASGQLKIGGQIGLLVRHHDMFAQLPRTLSPPYMTYTTYPLA